MSHAIGTSAVTRGDNHHTWVIMMIDRSILEFRLASHWSADMSQDINGHHICVKIGKNHKEL